MRNPLRRDPNRPTLKQRAAALKATAACLIRKPKNTPNADADLCALAGPWEAACRLYDRRMEEQSAIDRAAALHPSYPGKRPEGSGPDWQDFHRRWLEHCKQSGIAAAEKASGDACLALGDIEDKIAALPARTLAGLQIKARVAERNSSINVEWPEGLGDGLVADLLSLTGRLPAVPVAPQAAPEIAREMVAATDPIIAAINASRTAHAAVEAWSNAAETRAGPLSEGDFEEEKRLCDAQWKTRENVANTVPTTAAGRLALLEWLRWQMENYSLLDGSPPDQHSHFWEFSYNALKAALAWDGPAAVHDTGADTELIALGRAFDAAAARAQEAEAAHEADRNDEQKLNAANEAAEPAYALAEQIAPLPVHTLAGVHVKLRLAAFYWTCSPRGAHEDEHTGEIAIRSLYRSTPGIVLGTGPFDVRIVPEASATEETDLSLSNQIIACWREYGTDIGMGDPDETEASRMLSERRDALIDAAEALPATPENTPAKALALAWIDYVEHWQNGRARDAYATNGRLVLDIDTAICGRRMTEF